MPLPVCDNSKPSVGCSFCGATLQTITDDETLDDVAVAHWSADGPWSGPCTADTPWLDEAGQPADPHACDATPVLGGAPDEQPEAPAD